MARDLGVVATLLAPVRCAGALGLGGWGLALLLACGIRAVWRAPTAALVVLLPGLLLTSCVPRPVTLSPALQARVMALADRLAALPVDPETGEPGATALLAAWRTRVSPPPPAVSSRPPLWAPAVPEEVSNVP